MISRDRIVILSFSACRKKEPLNYFHKIYTSIKIKLFYVIRCLKIYVQKDLILLQNT